MILYIISILIIYQFVGYPLLMELITIRLKSEYKDYNYVPFISIIVATYNEEKVIERRIENLLNLNYPKEMYEIIVVDSNSIDRTAEIVRSIILKHSLNGFIKLVMESKRNGKVSAINLGLGYAKGGIIVITDANSLFNDDALKELAPHFKNPIVGAVSGRYSVSNPHETLPGIESFYWEMEDTIFTGESILDSVSTVVGTISAWRRDLMNFRPITITEDLDMTIQVRRKGYRIRYEPQAIAYEQAATTHEDQIKQRKRTSIGTIQNIFEHNSYFMVPNNLFSLLIFPSHKILTMLSPFMLLSILILYAIIPDHKVIVLHFFINILIFAIGLKILLYIKYRYRQHAKKYSISTQSIFNMIHYVVLNEYLIFFAWIDFFFKRYSLLWEKAESTR